MLRGGMAEEELVDVSTADLREVEDKVGRKTPESLLIWMRDAADFGDGWWSDLADRGEPSSAFSFLDKIRGLKQEMRLLRSADVKILRQLVTVHEGIEAMRWLMEERGAVTSRGSSSASSLVTVEEHGLCRESRSPSQDLTEASGEESADPPPHADDAESVHKRDLLIPESSGEKPPSPYSRFEVTRGSPPGLANSFVDAKLEKSQLQDSKVAPLQGLKENVGTIRKALLRSTRRRRRNGNDISPLTKQSEETRTRQQTQRSFGASQHIAMKEEELAPKEDTSVLGYDVQWCWENSQDEVTYL